MDVRWTRAVLASEGSVNVDMLANLESKGTCLLTGGLHPGQLEVGMGVSSWCLCKSTAGVCGDAGKGHAVGAARVSVLCVHVSPAPLLVEPASICSV